MGSTVSHSCTTPVHFYLLGSLLHQNWFYNVAIGRINHKSPGSSNYSIYISFVYVLLQRHSAGVIVVLVLVFVVMVLIAAYVIVVGIVLSLLM